MQVNIQTDLVRDIPCGTQGGTVIHFEKIEVVNRLRCDTTPSPASQDGLPLWERQRPPLRRTIDFLSTAFSGDRRRDNVLQTVQEFGVNYDKTWIYDKMYICPHYLPPKLCSSCFAV